MKLKLNLTSSSILFITMMLIFSAFDSAAAMAPVLSYTVSDYNGQMISCAGADDGSIDLTITGTTGIVSIAWTGPGGFTSFSEDISNLAAGDYTVVVSDATGNSSLTIQILAPAALAINANISNKNGFGVSCKNGTDGAIDVSVSGGTAPYVYLWSDGTNTYSTEDLSGYPAGNYSLTVSDANNCSISGAYTLTEPNQNIPFTTQSSYIGGYHVSCADALDGKIDVTPSGGVSPHTFNWEGPNNYSSTDAHLTGIAAGSYALTLTDNNGCIVQDTVELIAPDPLAINLSGPSMINGHHFICYGQTNGSIVSNVVGGTPFYDYDWSGPNGAVFSSKDLVNVGAGAYNVTISDTNGCTSNASITLTQPDSIIVTATVSDYDGFGVSCSGNDGAIDVSVTGGAGGYGYYWIGSNSLTYTTEDISGVTAGTYSLNLSDASNCTFSVDYVLSSTSSIQGNASTSNTNGYAISCASGNDGSIDLNLSSTVNPKTITWTGPNGFSSSDEDISGLEAGTYSVTVTSVGSCAWDSSFVLSAPNELSASLSSTSTNGFNVACSGENSGEITVSTSGGVAPISHSWSGPNGFSSPNLSLSNIRAGAYSLALTDANGCSFNDSIKLTEPSAALGASFSIPTNAGGTNISCANGNDGSVDMSIIGGQAPYAISWTLPSGMTDANEDLAGLAAGTYAVTIEDANSCSYSDSIMLSASTPLALLTMSTSQFSGGHAVSCANANDGSIAPSFTGGNAPYTVSWLGPNSFTSANSAINSLEAGTYVYTVNDALGCSMLDSITLTAPAAISAIISTSQFNGGVNISCENASDGSITVSPNGGSGNYNFTWTGPNGFTATTAQLSNLDEGNYCVSVVDQNGCAAQSCVDLMAPGEIDVTSLTSDALCGDAVGSADITVTGGSAPYNFNWSNGANSEDINNVSSGVYTVSVSDQNGCTQIHALNIGGTTGVSLGANIQNTSCATGNDGSIDLTVLSGVGPFSFDWSSGETSQDITGVMAGNYTVSVSDSQGCSDVMSFNIDEPLPIQIDLILSDYNGFNVSQFNGTDGSANANITGGTAPYTTGWSTGESSMAINNVGAGSYSITVSDANGCTTTSNFDLTAPYDLAMPNGFSPNGDGYNDSFVIQGIELYPNNSFTVLNRWGDVVFAQNDYRNQWRGRNNGGDELGDGTYFVLFVAEDQGIEMTGYVELRR